MKTLNKKHLDAVSATISKYDIFPLKEIAVAFSGGKDSLFLCLILRDLGYNVTLVTLDVGYSVDWTTAKNLAKYFGFGLHILNMCDIDSSRDSEVLSELQKNYESIQRISKEEHVGMTICTPCYNSKLLLLKWWGSTNSDSQIAFGHHGSDAVVSFLKSYFMYLDRWQLGHDTCLNENFRTLIESKKPEFCVSFECFRNSYHIDKMLDLVDEQFIGTDEPILRKITGTDIMIRRPMFGIFEEDIKDYYKDMNIAFQASECEVRKLKDPLKYTPREMVHHLLLDFMPRQNIELIHEIVKKSLDKKGCSLSNVRNRRDSILGSNYKVKSIKL